MQQYNSIFFVGIKGVAMANLARICFQMGKKVSGSDVSEDFITDIELKDISIITTFDGSSLPSDVELVIYSAAHSGLKNPQVLEAKKRGISVLHQAQFIGELLNQFHTSIAVAGCHGKTTTSALLAFALTKLGKEPSYMVGVSEFNEQFGGEYGKKDFFVLEADEYGLNPPEDKTPKFHLIKTTHALITNIDFDHPDVFDDIEQTKDAFMTFIKNIKQVSPSECLVLCADDTPLMQVASKLERETYITYGQTKDADVVIENIKSTSFGTSFSVRSQRLRIADTFRISLYGEKNVLNTVGAISMLRLLDFSLTQIQTAIEGFTGAKRRFELISTIEDTYILDDYAHHPSEIKATIQAARSRFPDKRIVVLFQPHTFSRTKSLQKDFIAALSEADFSLVAPIFGSARESTGANTITSKDLVAQNVSAYESKEDLLTDLEKKIQKGDVIFTMGAGDIYKLAPEIKKLLT